MLSPPQSRAARALLDWTQAELAARSSISLSTVRDFEAGRRMPMINNVKAMQRAFEEAGILLFNDDQPGARLMRRPMSSAA